MKFNLAENITILDRAPDLYKSMLHGLSDEMIFSNEGDNWIESPISKTDHKNEHHHYNICLLNN